MDIVKSTNLHYNKFNDMLKNKIEKINNVIQNFYGYDRIYNISQGDEIQILIPFDRNLGNIIMLTLCYLVPFKSRYAISLGDFDDNIKRNSWDMNGPIFWNARDKLEKLKNSKKYDGLIVS